MSEHFPLCCVFTSYIAHCFLWNYRYRSIINLFLPLHTMIDRCLHLMLHHLDNRCGCMLWFYRTRNEVDKWWRRNDIIIRRRPVGIVLQIKHCGRFSSNTTFLLATMDLGRWVAFPFLPLSISVADFSFYACCCGRRLEEKSGVVSLCLLSCPLPRRTLLRRIILSPILSTVTLIAKTLCPPLFCYCRWSEETLFSLQIEAVDQLQSDEPPKHHLSTSLRSAESLEAVLLQITYRKQARIDYCIQ